MSQYFHLRKIKTVMNLTVTRMDNWLTILKQTKMEALVLATPLYSTWNRQLTVRRNLVHQLIGTFTSRKRTGRKRSLRIGTAVGNAVPMGKLLFLFPTLWKISGHAKVCALCTEKKKKAPSGKGKQTTYKCKQCDLPLCRVGCFLEYHEQRNVDVQN